MSQFDGIGRIYTVDLKPQVSNSPKTDRTDRDKKRHEKEEKKEEEALDTVELHEEESLKDPSRPKIEPKLSNEDEDGLDISA